MEGGIQLPDGMTKRELIEALEPFHDGTRINVAVFARGMPHFPLRAKYVKVEKDGSITITT